LSHGLGQVAKTNSAPRAGNVGNKIDGDNWFQRMSRKKLIKTL
jgi:hypothetical protein